MLLNFILYQKNFVNSCKTSLTLSFKTKANCRIIRQGENWGTLYSKQNLIGRNFVGKKWQKIAQWRNFLPTNIFCRWKFPPTNTFYRRLFLADEYFLLDGFRLFCSFLLKIECFGCQISVTFMKENPIEAERNLKISRSHCENLPSHETFKKIILQ